MRNKLAATLCLLFAEAAAGTPPVRRVGPPPAFTATWTAMQQPRMPPDAGAHKVWVNALRETLHIFELRCVGMGKCTLTETVLNFCIPEDGKLVSYPKTNVWATGALPGGALTVGLEGNVVTLRAEGEGEFYASHILTFDDGTLVDYRGSYQRELGKNAEIIAYVPLRDSARFTKRQTTCDLFVLPALPEANPQATNPR